MLKKNPQAVLPDGGRVKQLYNYLFITYIVTSKPKRISVAAGLVQAMMFLLK